MSDQRHAIFFARPAAVFMLLVRKASANRSRLAERAECLERARIGASIAARRSAGRGRLACAAHRSIGRGPAAVGLGGVDLPLTVRRHAAGLGQPRDVAAIDLAPDVLRARRGV